MLGIKQRYILGIQLIYNLENEIQVITRAQEYLFLALSVPKKHMEFFASAAGASDENLGDTGDIHWETLWE